MLGVLHSQRGEHQAAVRQIREAAELRPNQAPLHADLGLALQRAGRLEEAEASYRRALSLNPGFVEALFSLGNALHGLGRREEAVEAYRSALRGSPDDIRIHNNLGNSLRELGRAAEAAACYREALRREPRYADAWTNLGLARADAGEVEEAVDCYRNALQINPRSAETLHNLAAALLRKGLREEALEAARLALELNPGFFETCLLVANALKQWGQYPLAAEWYENALELRPGNVEVLDGWGSVLQQQGDFAGALERYEQALRLDPGSVVAHTHLGNLWREQKRYAEAEASYRRALELDPACSAAANNLGNVCEDQQRLEEALGWYERTVDLDAASAEAHSNLGNVLRRLGRLDEAEHHGRRAVELKPDLWPAVNNLGALLNDLDRRAEALALYRDALSLKPDNAVIWYNVGSVLAEMRQIEEAIKAYRKAYELDPKDDNVAAALAIRCQQACEWRDLEPLWRQSLEGQVRGSGDPSPFSLLSMPSTPAEQLVCARRWGLQHSRGIPAGQFQHRGGPRERLRIGYLSADFRKHAVAYLVAELVELHDRRRFEVLGYSYGPDDSSAMRARLSQAFDRFTDVRSEIPPRTAQRIYHDGVDILVDLTGITQHCRPRILAHRAAPIQVNYLGYPGTMGAEFIDYILVDRYIARPEEADFYSEKLVWLPASYQINDRKREVSARTPTRADCGLPEQGFVFCCFNNTFKINPETFDSWMRILKQVEGSVLWLIGDNALAERNLRREAEARGVDAARLVFAPRREMPDHLARQKLADLFLDTLPYGAHTTASDALWVGLPVVTLAGDTFASRVAGSLLLNTGLPELITHTRADYEALALRLARDPAELRALGAKIAANVPSAPLFDAPSTTRAIETAYERMWALYEAGRPPEPMSV